MASPLITSIYCGFVEERDGRTETCFTTNARRMCKKLTYWSLSVYQLFVLKRINDVDEDDCVNMVVMGIGNETTLNDTFPLNSLLPENTNDYYRYNGSLTTPSCYQSVNWTVFKEPITISTHQVISLKLTDASNYDIDCSVTDAFKSRLSDRYVLTNKTVLVISCFSTTTVLGLYAPDSNQKRSKTD